MKKVQIAPLFYFLAMAAIMIAFGKVAFALTAPKTAPQTNPVHGNYSATGSQEAKHSSKGLCTKQSCASLQHKGRTC